MNALHPLRLISIAFLILFLTSPTSLSINNEEDKVTLSTPEQIKEDADLVPCKNDERLKAVRALFEKMGAQAPDISVEEYKKVVNISVCWPGSTEELVVIGAHYDKVSKGCGAVDNWSGIVALGHLYRTLRGIPLKKTLLFVAFGREEEGLIGSKAMVKAIAKDQKGQYCAMVNLDSLGLGAPQVVENLSSKKLVRRAADLAKHMNMPFGQAVIPNVTSDSRSFIRKKIPAITIHGLSREWWKIIHTENDQPSVVNSTSIHLCYRLALTLVLNIDDSPCDAWR